MTDQLYYHGVQVNMTDTEVSVADNRLNMQNVGIANAKYAINYDTSVNKFLE